jgi:hypothetical protein
LVVRAATGAPGVAAVRGKLLFLLWAVIVSLAQHLCNDCVHHLNYVVRTMEEGPYKARLRERIAGLPPLQKVMLALDVALTGHEPEEVVTQYHHYPTSLEHWVQRDGWQLIWYLSDSGYSRVVWSEETGELFLTSNSRQQVKDAWEAAAPQREAVVKQLKAEYRAMGGDRFAEALCLAENVLNESPELKTLKAQRRSLSPEEREQADGCPIWKAAVNGKTWYVCNTHRAYQARPTIKGAVHAWRNGVEQSG